MYYIKFMIFGSVFSFITVSSFRKHTLGGINNYLPFGACFCGQGLWVSSETFAGLKMGGKRKGIPRGAVAGWKMKKHKIEKEYFGDWAGLPDELLEDILGRLPLPDCFASSSVCKPWGSVIAKYLDGCDRMVPFFVKRGQNEATARTCFSVLEKSNFEMELPQAFGSYIWGSFQNWLFLARREKSCLDISLLNPFSGENIILPTATTNNYLMVLSAAPNDDNCICLIVSDRGIASWTPGAKQWHTIRLSSFRLLDALYHGGCFYLLYENDEIVIINEKNVMSLMDGERGASASVLSQTLSVKLPDYPISDCVRHYLVESNGEIMLVSRFFYINHTSIDKTSAFEIYKLDLHKMAWLKLDKLEDRILFVGSCCSRSFRTNDLGDAFANNVYFINDAHCIPRNEWCFFYQLVDFRNDSDYWDVFCTQTPNHWPSVFNAEAKRWAGVWLTAPLWWCLQQMRR